MSEQNKQLVNQGESNDLSLVFPNSQSSYWCSIKPKDESSQLLIYRAREGEGKALTDLINTEIVVSDFLCHPVSLIRESGETIDVLRMVLISPDGECYTTCSAGIQSSVRTLCQIYGLPPWTGGRRFRVKQLALKNGRRTFKLDPVVIDTATKGTKK